MLPVLWSSDFFSSSTYILDDYLMSKQKRNPFLFSHHSQFQFSIGKKDNNRRVLKVNSNLILLSICFLCSCVCLINKVSNEPRDLQNLYQFYFSLNLIFMSGLSCIRFFISACSSHRIHDKFFFKLISIYVP